MSVSNYDVVESHLFVKLEVAHYKANESATPAPVVLTFSDRQTTTTIGDYTYQGVGNLMSITDTVTELRSSGYEMTVTLSGIPNSSIYEIVNSRIKGSPITIYRGFFHPDTNQPIQYVNTKFIGVVNNYSLQEDYNVDTKTSTNTIVLTCSNIAQILANKIAGRKTNTTSEQKYFPNDISMNRVGNLENASFNFGIKK